MRDAIDLNAFKQARQLESPHRAVNRGDAETWMGRRKARVGVDRRKWTAGILVALQDGLALGRVSLDGRRHILGPIHSIRESQ